MQRGYGKRIQLFDKTGDDIVCPHFFELKWANGCRFNCSWCYLNGTFRFQERGKKPHIYDITEVEQSLRLFAKKMKEPKILNAGELSDGLLNEGFIATIGWNYLKNTPHKILILTKDIKCAFIRNQAKYLKDTTIMSYSLNARNVAERWEKGAPTIKERLESCKELQELGYEVRVRIDPIVPIETAMNDYTLLIDDIFWHFNPERITLGSLRGLQSTINNSIDRSWIKYLSEGSGWGLKVKDDTREMLYKRIIDHLNEEYDYQNVAMCKETPEMWEKLGMNPKEIRCNCIW